MAITGAAASAAPAVRAAHPIEHLACARRPHEQSPGPGRSRAGFHEPGIPGVVNATTGEDEQCRVRPQARSALP